MKKFIIIILILLYFMVIISAKNKNPIYKFEKSVKDILNKVSPSIVKVIAENNRKYVATGIVMDKSYILSNIIITRHHYDKIYAETKDGKQFPVTLIGKDSHSGLILLKYKNNKLKFLKTGKSAQTGDWVVLVGAFYNKIPAIYQGIVSSFSNIELILNAPIPPGGVGGAVINKNGQLIGIVRGRLKFSISPTMSFNNDWGNITISGQRLKSNDLCYGIPIRRINNIINQLKKYGRVKQSWIGINVSPYKTVVNKGLLITSIVKNSPAFKSKLKGGDIIVKIDNKNINSVIDLQETVNSIIPGNKINVTVIRNNSNKNILLTVGENSYNKSSIKQLKAQMRRAKTYYKYSRFPKIDIEKYKINFSGTPKLGVFVKELNKKDAIKFKSKKGYGLLITKLIKHEPAQKYGMKKWDIIIGANDINIKTKDDLRNVLRNNMSKKINFKIYRNGKLNNISIIPENNLHFNKEALRDSLKDISLLISDDININNTMKLNKIKEEIESLKTNNNYITKTEKDKIQKNIKILRRKMKKYYEMEYKITEEKRKQLLKKLKELEEQKISDKAKK